MVSLTTAIADLPVEIGLGLQNALNKDNLWEKIVSSDKNTLFFVGPDDVQKFLKDDDPAKSILHRWGVRGLTVHGFLIRLQELSRFLGPAGDIPQLLLGRKFKPIRWSRPEEIVISVKNEGRDIRLDCKAIGFPFPQFIWQKDGKTIQGANAPSLVIPRCSCEADAVYRCFAKNEVPDGYPFSSIYRTPKKQYSSSLASREFDVSPFIGGAKCARCEAEKLEQLQSIIKDIELDAEETTRRVEEVPADTLIASDKVALIISNCVYQYLPELVTPLCDAETLAEALQDDGMQYKTVTLADLTLSEMQFVVKEFKKLLGAGVYAVFYFVGHGFEVNGQCYLLPVDAPLEAHHPKHCLSMDWILAELAPFKSSLNLILLDVCRKFIPFDCIPAFVEYTESFKKVQFVNRNTVYGYSTSGGVGAYEVRGQVNGVFMTYLKEHVTKNLSVVDMINRVLTDIGEDSKVSHVQVPELRSTLSKPRSLRDPLIYRGHTASFTDHTSHWEKMHELPLPVLVKFTELKLLVTIWFRFCGHFTNKVYVLSSVSDLYDSDEVDDYDIPPSKFAQNHLAHLTFSEELETSSERVLEDDEEGISWQVLLSHLQRLKSELTCDITMKRRSDDAIVARARTNLGDVLFTKIVREYHGINE